MSSALSANSFMIPVIPQNIGNEAGIGWLYGLTVTYTKAKGKFTGISEVVGIECGLNYNNCEEYGTLPAEQSLSVFEKNQNKNYFGEDEERRRYQKNKPVD